jgi:hypothetical protein
MVTEANHKTLADSRWAELTTREQFGNIGSEVFRSLKWKLKNNDEMADAAFERGLELIDLTIKYADRPATRLEACRLRENYCDIFTNSLTDQFDSLNKYFIHFYKK